MDGKASNVSRRRSWSFLVIVLMVVAAVMILKTTPALSGPYLDSAHGNSDYGVNRDRMADVGYATGNCAHCHEQHGSLDGETVGPHEYALFYDFVVSRCNLFCYWCHRAANSEGQAVENYPYSVNFGGVTEHFPSIYNQFCNPPAQDANCGSNHSLDDVYRFIRNRWEFGDTPDPCSACHNPHLAQRNWDFPSDGTIRTAISRPSDHDNLWGDDAGERMDSYNYQAPYYGGGPWNPGSGPFEPAGDSVSDGSNVPDYVTFCLDCHEFQQYDSIRGKTVKAIDWGLSGDRHGGAPANTCDQAGTDEGALNPPYTDTTNSNYVLSCLDCHEPHGSMEKQHLIRRGINGRLVDSDVDLESSASCYPPGSNWNSICQPCHELTHPTWENCGGCHGHGVTSAAQGDCQGEPMF